MHTYKYFEALQIITDTEYYFTEWFQNKGVYNKHKKPAFLHIRCRCPTHVNGQLVFISMHDSQRQGSDFAFQL
jgi:hypothetical protein